MIGTKVIFTYLGEILKGEILSTEEEMVLIKVKSKNYLVESKQVLRRLF